LLRRRVIGRRRLRRDPEAEQAGVELAAAFQVGHREPQVMNVAGRNLPGHGTLPPERDCSRSSCLVYILILPAPGRVQWAGPGQRAGRHMVVTTGPPPG